MSKTATTRSAVSLTSSAMAVGRVGSSVLSSGRGAGSGRLRVADRGRRVEQGEDTVRRGHRRHALVVEPDQLAERPEHFASQHQYDQQRLQLHLAVVDADSTPHQRDDGAC